MLTADAWTEFYKSLEDTAKVAKKITTCGAIVNTLLKERFPQIIPNVIIMVCHTTDPVQNRRLLQLPHLVERRPKNILAAIRLFTPIKERTKRCLPLTISSMVQNLRMTMASRSF